MKSPGAELRAAAARALHRVRRGQSLKAVLAEWLPQLADVRDRALAEAMLFAACRGGWRYQALLGQLLQRPLPSRHGEVEALLMLGLAQLDALRLPAYAAISASAEAARRLGAPALVGLVNGVLRRYQREAEQLATGLDSDAARCAHPPWLLQRLQADWPQDWPAIVAANNTQAPLWLRVNRRRCRLEAYQQALQSAGLSAEPAAGLPAALRLPSSLPPTQLPGWGQGWVSVQDGAAQWALEALQLADGQRVLDACAAPGGKTAAILEAAAVDLLALDRDPQRLQRIAPSLARLGLAAELRCADAARPAEWWDGRPFDCILLDAPCSATGVIRRQPDIKWHRRASDLPALVAMQSALLAALWPLLAPGGRLVYATCSLLREENQAVIAAALAAHPQLRVAELAAGCGRPAGAGRQRLPGEQEMDGFFLCALERAC